MARPVWAASDSNPSRCHANPPGSNCGCNSFVTAASCSSTAFPTVANRFPNRLPHYPVPLISFERSPAPSGTMQGTIANSDCSEGRVKAGAAEAKWRVHT